MSQGSTSLRGSITGLGIGDVAVQPSDIQTAAPIGTRTLQALAIGNNTITIPSGTTTVILIPPSGNTATLILKGVNADTGFRLHNTNWQAIHPDSSVASIVINSTAVLNLEVVLI